ncbi:MAG: ParB-like chromosome segregation protein Spo0J [Flavobacteriaceae bacterium]|jgi:ParB-like chromosome segregation protein Spo0J|tara:strand:- start:90 stop:617 length:528 start_codon:yes stop_codon:yes gene_type:complete
MSNKKNLTKELVSINKVKPNKNNPRHIKDHKFQKLVSSIKSFPQMLEKRPIIVDEKMIVLGGNMRLKACQEAGLKEVWIDMAEDWTEEQKNEFIIKDNVGFGEWEWDILANQWEETKLNEWGMDVWQTEVSLEDFFEEATEEKKPTQAEWYNKFVEYIKENYNNAYNEACKSADK